MAREQAHSFARDIRRTLEDEIMRGRLAPGQRVDEQRVAERFGVSRTPVREALHQLAASGLVQLRGRQGALVSQLSIPDVLDGFLVMGELEGLCARLAARRITAQQRETLESAHQACIDAVEAHDAERFYEANKGFHEGIYVAARNRMLFEQVRNLRLRLAPYRRLITFQPGRMEASIDEHAAVLAAIVNGDANHADALMQEHVSILGDSLNDFVSALRHADDVSAAGSM